MQEFSTALVSRSDEYKASLPSHITPERFQRVVVTAANLNPDLLRADRRSLLNACSKAASDGLLPDGREGALVIFNKKDGDKYIKSVQWMPMVAGIIKKARQSGEIAVLDAQIVYQNELDLGRFSYKRVDGVPKVDHEPIIQGPRGAAVLVYSVVKFKDGSIDYEVLHADDVNKMRSVSRSKDKGPWAEWTEEMWKKSAIRRHAKRLPVSSELFDAIARDDEMTEFERRRNDADRAMLVNARAQLGAPNPEPAVIDAESEEVADDEAEAPADEVVTEREETALERGIRLLGTLTKMVDVNDLSSSIAEELSDAELPQWDQFVATKRAELTKHIGKK